MQQTRQNPRTIFTVVELSSGKKATILDLNGGDIFRATIAANGNTGQMMLEIFKIAVRIDGRNSELEDADVEKLPACDVMAIMDAISVQLTKVPK